jgi:hypothetical protein
MVHPGCYGYPLSREVPEVSTQPLFLSEVVVSISSTDSPCKLIENMWTVTRNTERFKQVTSIHEWCRLWGHQIPEGFTMVLEACLHYTVVSGKRSMSAADTTQSCFNAYDRWKQCLGILLLLNHH